jgi:hypothetical protein
MEQHYNTKHLEGLAVESPPAPATVANPPPMPSFGGYPIPPVVPHQKTGSIAIDMILMKRSHPKAFWVYTGLLALFTAFVTSTLFLYLILLRI